MPPHEMRSEGAGSTHLSRLTPAGRSAAMSAMTPIRYMWSATDSGPCNPRLTQPALFVVYSTQTRPIVNAGRD
jgi:hypothetical protein